MTSLGGGGRHEGDVMEGDVEQIEGDDVEEVLVDEAEEGGK